MKEKPLVYNIKMLKGNGASVVHVDAMTGEVVKDKKYGGLKASAENNTSRSGSSTTRRRTPPRTTQALTHDGGACVSRRSWEFEERPFRIAGTGALPLSPTALVRALFAALPLVLPLVRRANRSPRSRSHRVSGRDARSGVAPLRRRASTSTACAARRCALQLPVWSPGRYAKMDFAKNVQEFRVTDAAGRPLRWDKTDGSRWVVQHRRRARACACATASSPTSCPARSACSIPRTPTGTAPRSSCTSRATSRIPSRSTSRRRRAGRSSTATRARADQRDFRFPNYDRLIDTPTEVAPAVLARLVRGGRQALPHDGAPQRSRAGRRARSASCATSRRSCATRTPCSARRRSSSTRSCSTSATPAATGWSTSTPRRSSTRGAGPTRSPCCPASPPRRTSTSTSGT